MKKLLALVVIALLCSCERECGLCVTDKDENGTPLGYEDTIMVCDGFKDMYHCIRPLK